MRTLPKAPQRLDGEIGMLGFWVPGFWKNLENVPKNIPNKYRKLVRNRSTSNKMGQEFVQKEQTLAADLFQGFLGLKILKTT